ncbi:MAG: 2-C-methyl-D-erythritol 2,4-cyclodiphosphate synthase [Thermosipho sp. (in: thermotogales)]|nr:2-C-methyl-D-erythritol 2,4-cyclodiphosphate synthase [Thermosipho sp. (in: thermotogales)]MDK2899697.1 2-C-methyl-D-erythritol 2,4-cyclodiphosphate synthase [Thermosipho sp. (in: thermotogales)]
MKFTTINEDNYIDCAKFIYEEKKEYFDYLFKKDAFEIIKKAILFNIPPFLMENSLVIKSDEGKILGVLLYASKSAFRHRYEKWIKILGFKVLGTGVKLASIIGQILLNFSVDDVYIISLSAQDFYLEYELLYRFVISHDYKRILTDVTEGLIEKYKRMGFVVEKGLDNKIFRMYKKSKLNIASGIGWDTHPIKKDRKLILGGVEIESDIGLDGHSDADVLIHSIVDSFVGVSLKKDIGELFPEKDVPKGISSVFILENVLKSMKENGFFPKSVDCVLITDFRLGKYRAEISKNLEKIINCPVSIKFKTGNNVYPETNLKAMTAMCVSNIISI